MTRILLVEDSIDLAKLVSGELETCGYEVCIAGDGIQALEIRLSTNPDLIILDWMLPRLDGLEVLRRIRQTSSIPVLMLTARSDETDRVVGLELGADDYLTKPFSSRELIARVRALLRRIENVQRILAADQQPGADQLVYGDLSIDPATYTAALRNLPLDLTRTEFELLHLLLRNPGRVFSRSYLLDTIWQESYIPGDRSVDNAVLRLRKKLANWGDEIETVWGVGYRLRKIL
ncbi:MAG: response regulator transcription factor [Anaerolineaceae bacterium]